jgi:hypothetical protein
MTTKTQSVAAEVEAIRERLALEDYSWTEKIRLVRYCLAAAHGYASRQETAWAEPIDYEAIELWARLAADLAGQLRP